VEAKERKREREREHIRLSEFVFAVAGFGNQVRVPVGRTKVDGESARTFDSLLTVQMQKVCHIERKDDHFVTPEKRANMINLTLLIRCSFQSFDTKKASS
jgi:hypothetical protein